MSAAQDVLKPWLVSEEGLGEWRGFCVNCEDPRQSKSPSAGYNFAKGVWHCMGKCDARGQIKTLVRKIKSGEIKAGANRPSLKSVPTGDEVDDDRKPLPDTAALKRWNKILLASDVQVKYLRDKRGIDDEELLKRLLIGYDPRRGRFMIPIFDERGELVNVRMYKVNARANNKMISWGKGWGEGRIYGFDTLREHDTVLLCEGEWDRICALSHGINAVSHTSGAKVFKPEWGKSFKGKNVYIAYDEDAVGKAGAQRARRVLSDHAESVYGVTLGLGIEGGDVTDFFVGGRIADDMADLMSQAARWHTRGEEHTTPTNGKAVTLAESYDPRHDVIEVKAMIAGRSETYSAPKKLHGVCDQSAGTKCNTCVFAGSDGQRMKEFPPDDPRLLEFVGATDVTVRSRLYPKLLEANCTNRVQTSVLEAYSIEELVVAPSVEHRNGEADTQRYRSVYSVGTYKTEANQLARIVGRQRPNPKDQSMVIHGWEYETLTSDIDDFKMDPEVKRRLLRFRPKQGQSPLDKCYEIAEDLSANVTHIYGRPHLHVGYDLVWHSALKFSFGGKEVTKGWLECLVIGDTRTGKSETAASLLQHYKAGQMRSLEGASFAGLVGGAEQHGSYWLVRWGALPLNDRRLVVLDEMSGLYASNKQSKGIIEEMSSIRSEGKAQIQKIVAAQASARTRLIWISNPVDGHVSLSNSYNGCIPALQDLVRNPEDIARFDFVMAAAQSDVDSGVINRPKHKWVKHRAVSQAASELVMWAWSRRSDQIKFLTGVEDLIYAQAERMGQQYVEDPPLIQRANVRLKIARIAVAIAARTFSSDPTGEKLLVKKIHVRSAVRFLNDIYSHDAMGYAEHSERRIKEDQRAKDNINAAREFLRKLPAAVRVLSILGATPFKHHDFIEMGEFDEDEARTLISKLTMWSMLETGRVGQKRAKPTLLRLLKELEG